MTYIECSDSDSLEQISERRDHVSSSVVSCKESSLLRCVEKTNGFLTTWSAMPEVKNSKILHRLSKDEITLQEVRLFVHLTYKILIFLYRFDKFWEVKMRSFLRV